MRRMLTNLLLPLPLLLLYTRSSMAAITLSCIGFQIGELPSLALNGESGISKKEGEARADGNIDICVIGILGFVAIEVVPGFLGSTFTTIQQRLGRHDQVNEYVKPYEFVESNQITPQPGSRRLDVYSYLEDEDDIGNINYVDQVGSVKDSLQYEQGWTGHLQHPQQQQQQQQQQRRPQIHQQQVYLPKYADVRQKQFLDERFQQQQKQQQQQQQQQQQRQQPQLQQQQSFEKGVLQQRGVVHPQHVINTENVHNDLQQLQQHQLEDDLIEKEGFLIQQQQQQQQQHEKHPQVHHTQQHSRVSQQGGKEEDERDVMAVYPSNNKNNNPTRYYNKQNTFENAQSGSGTYPGAPPQNPSQQGLPQEPSYPQQGLPQEPSYPQQGLPQEPSYPQQGLPQEPSQHLHQAPPQAAGQDEDVNFSRAQGFGGLIEQDYTDIDYTSGQLVSYHWNKDI